MKKFKFNKPLVESHTAPKDINTYWVDVDENSGKVSTVREYNSNTKSWEESLKNVKTSAPFLSGVTIVDIPEHKWGEYTEVISTKAQLTTTGSYETFEGLPINITTLKQEILEQYVPLGSELVIFRCQGSNTMGNTVEYTVRWFFV
jgi:hypothetical protein